MNTLPQQVIAKVSAYVFPAIVPMFGSDRMHTGMNQLIIANSHYKHHYNGLKNVHSELSSYMYNIADDNEEADDFDIGSYILARMDGMPGLVGADDWEYNNDLDLWWWEQ